MGAELSCAVQAFCKWQLKAYKRTGQNMPSLHCLQNQAEVTMVCYKLRSFEVLVLRKFIQKYQKFVKC